MDEHMKMNIHILHACGECVCSWECVHMYVSVSAHIEAID